MISCFRLISLEFIKNKSLQKLRNRLVLKKKSWIKYFRNFVFKRIHLLVNSYKIKRDKMSGLKLGNMIYLEHIHNLEWKQRTPCYTHFNCNI